MAEQESASQRIAAELRAAILSGALAPGDRLPSSRALMAEHGISKVTAERVLTTLRAEGYVVARSGAGSFVRSFERIMRSSPARASREQWGAGRAMQDADTGSRPRAIDATVSEVAPPEWAAAALGLEAGELALCRDRAYAVDDRPVQLATSYIPMDLARGTAIVYTDSGPGGLYARLAEVGHGPAEFVEVIEVRMPLPEERRRLSLPTGTPVVEVTRSARDAAGRVIEVNRMVLDASAYTLSYSFEA